MHLMTGVTCICALFMTTTEDSDRKQSWSLDSHGNNVFRLQSFSRWTPKICAKLDHNLPFSSCGKALNNHQKG